MAEYIELSAQEKSVLTKQEEEKQYWFDWLKQFRATKEYPIKETAVDNFLRGYGEAVQYMLSVNEQLLLKSANVSEVIKCKDCKNWGGVVFGNACKRWSAPLAGMKNCTQPDDFCSYGERKGDENAENI